jgi:iron complex outermembrane receptor protein
MLAVTSLLAQRTEAQSVQPDSSAVEQVVVTGTSIRGVAPVGSNVITVDQKTMEASAPVNMEQLITSVTAISTANAAPQGANVNSLFQPQIHDVAGSISNATLAVVDGLRIPGAGGDSLVDPDIIPTAAIQRVEVLADGASSIYGSDAVSGVVNFITRDGYEGLQVTAQGGVGNSYSDDTASLLWGTKWDGGSVMVAGGYLYQSRLAKNSRDFLSMGDYTPVGGNNYDEVFGCPVASMVVPGNSGVYLSPASTTTVPNTQRSKNCNVQAYGDGLPEEIRENGLIKLHQDFGSRFSITLMANYSVLKTYELLGPGQVTGVTVYGPGSGKGGQINPFFLAPAGAPLATQETINWVDLAGNSTTQFGASTATEDVFYSTLRAKYDLSENWEISFTDALGRNNYDTGTRNAFCLSCANLALNGTGQTNGSTTATDVAGQNTVTLNLPLTTSNALDIWHPAGDGNQTAALVSQSLYKGTTYDNVVNTFDQARLEIDGPLVDLPAGQVKGAFGAEEVNYHFFSEHVGFNGNGALLNNAQALTFRTPRTVYSAYGELNFPIISPEMDIPLANKINIDISGRWDHYSDVGSTANPKYALDWQMVEGFKLRANYSSSFVAPPIGVVGDLSQGGEYSGGATSPPSFSVPVSIYPQVTQLPGCATATVSCNIGAGTLAPGLKRQYGTALTGAKPQTGFGWSVGADIEPDFLPGFSTNVTLWNTRYKGGVTAPSPANIYASSILHNDLQLFPGGATQPQIDNFTRVPEGAVVNGIPSTVYFTLDADEANVLNLDIQGVDLTTNYQFDTGDYGVFAIGEGATIFTKFTESTLNAPSYNILGTSGINSTFPSVQTQSRMNLEWTNDIISVDAFWNYTSGYHNEGGTTVNPIILDANGNYSAGGDVVKSNSTFDLHVAYNFLDGILGGDQVYIDVKNIFDKAPPFYNYLNHDQSGDNGYNSFISNPIGRVLSVGLRAKF